MTKLKIEGAGSYDYEGVQPFLGDLRLLKPFGFGWGTVIGHVSKLAINGSNYAELLDTDGFPDALCAWVWMLRMRAGERHLTIDDARALPVDGIEFVTEPGDRERLEADADTKADPSPTPAPTDSDRGDDAPAPAEPPTPPSTKTSRRRSPPASS